MRAVGYLVLGLFALTPVTAEASPSSGEAVAIIAGLAGSGAALGFAIVYSSIHSRQIAEGCIAEADGKRTCWIPARESTHFLTLAYLFLSASAQN